MTVSAPTADPATIPVPPGRTRQFLACGAAAGPLWAVVSFTQAATRSDYSFTTQPLSMLSTGDLGWLQITNFVVAGVLVVLGAVGLRRALPDARGMVRAAIVQGLTLAAAGVLVLDPIDTSGAAPTTLSWHAVGHLLAGLVSFIALAVLCVLLARRYARTGRRVAAGFSLLLAAGVVAGNAWSMSGGTYGSVTIAVGVVAAMLWSSRFHAALRRP